MAKVAKKVVAKKAEKKVAAAPKEKRITAASIVLGLLGMKAVPMDEAIIQAVHDGVENTKFDKTHLAWYKYQFKQGRWNDGEEQVIRQAPKVAAEKPAKAAKKVKKAKPAVEETEEEEVEG
jgi:hypothetical protein